MEEGDPVAAETDAKTTTQVTGPAATPQAGGGAPVKLARPETTLQDKYVLDQGTIFISGIQALVRLLLDQKRADMRHGLNTATFVSGYQGSPLGGFDKEVMRLGQLGKEHDIEFRTGLNEELAATAVYGSQIGQGLPGSRFDGVTGVWYGKNPGLDRAMDALRHANFAGTHPNGGALALVGDDPSCKSSTLPSGAEATLAALNFPTFYPGTLQEVLDLGQHAIACSRVSGLWSALKIVTNIADAAGTIQVWPERVVPVHPTVEYNGAPYRHMPNGRLLAPESLELERTLFGPRMELALQYGRLNGLNAITLPTRDAWLGIVAAGKTYYELLQALRELGLEQRDVERAGIRLMKVGMLWPHDRDAFRAFGRGLEEILVVEEKLPYIETAVRDALYGLPDPPRVLGKRDEHDMHLVPAESELDADLIALAVAGRIERHERIDSVHARSHAIAERRDALHKGPLPMMRTPFFCSGCPHNTSTVNPDGTLLGVGIGCHTMVLLNPDGKGTITGLTQMGGEGAQFVGAQPFLDTDEQFVQNLGDGTFHHSGSLAIRFAAASGVKMTYKLLYNSTVAMTGGQDVLGQLTVPELTTWLRLEGVKQVIVTTDDPGKYRGVELDPIARVEHRDRLPEAQAELAKVDGVTVLIHDQHCAAELRRLRKRGKRPTPAKRIHINERVCEGCGDCGVKSECLSVLPIETEFGRKTQIHQASCNLDYSCVKGDCPSFLEVIPAKGGKAKKQAPAPPADLPAPALRVARDDFMVRMPGVGGTGVVTVSQILQMAALLDGKHAYGLDQTGLAQKGGPVISDIRISRDRIEGSNKASTASADLLLGFDVLGAASPKNLLVADPERTVAVISTTATPTARQVVDPTVSFPAQRRNLKAIEQVTRAPENVYIDAQALSEALFGDHMPTNLLLIGAAYQHGTLPLSAEAIEHAIRLNGAAVEKSLAAFAWGRAAVARPELVDEILTPPGAGEREPSAKARAIVDATGASGELRRLLEIRVEDLIGYQSVRYAKRYADDVMEVARRDEAIGLMYARGLYKFMAYKDEYEVARLHLDTIERAKLDDAFGPGAKVKFMLHPPALRAMGLKRKLKFGRWFVPMFGMLKRGKRLRGTPFDPFGRAEVRRVERELIGEYRDLVTGAMEKLRPGNEDRVLELAGLADVVRGYEDIKLRNVAIFRERAAEITAAL